MPPKLKQLIELLTPAIQKVIEEENHIINANNPLDLSKLPSIHMSGDEL